MSPPQSDARIALHFEKFSSFVEDYASNLSLGGMFLRTPELRPVGSIVDFEIMLVDGFQLVRGLGEVLWVLPRATGESPAGMAVRFQALNDKGRELILKILEEQVKRGEPSFDLETAPEGALASRGAAVEPAADPEPADAGPPVGSFEALDLERKKILGEDGFTLLDADTSPPGEDSGDGSRSFEELEFDAPWGEKLPEIPLEVLEEALDREVSLPEPDAPFGDLGPLDDVAIDPDESSFAVLGEAFEEAAPSEAAARPETQVSEALDDSFFLAEEAADEIEMTGQEEDLIEPELDDSDFDPFAPEEEPVADFAAATQPKLAGLDGFDFPGGDDEPTLMTSDGRRPSPDEPAEVSEEPVSEGPVSEGPVSEGPASEEPVTQDFRSIFAPTEESPFELGAEERLTSEPAAAMEVPPLPAEPASPPMPPPAAVLEERPAAALEAGPSEPDGRPVEDHREYEDLFAEEPGSSATQVLKQAFKGSRKPLVLAAVVVLLLAAGYLLRDSLMGLLGSPAPAVGPTEAVARQAASSDAPEARPPVQARAGDAPQAESEQPAAEQLEAVPAGDRRPPVIQVAADPETAAATGLESATTESATMPAAPAVVAADSILSTPGGHAATRVDRITWRRAEGGTLVVVELDGDLGDDRFGHAALAYNPAKEMVTIRGIEEPYASGRVAVGSPEVQQIRTGHHLEPGGNELHLVFDFPDAAPRIKAVRGLGDRLEILIVR